MHGAILIEAIIILVLTAAVGLVYFLKYRRGAKRGDKPSGVPEETNAADDYEGDEVPTVSTEIESAERFKK